MTSEQFQRNDQGPEQAYLVGVHVRRQETVLSLEESLEELEMLAETAGKSVV